MDEMPKQFKVGTQGFRGPDPRYASDGFSTQCVHAGENWEIPDFRTPSTPVYNNNVFFYDKFQEIDDLVNGKRTGYGYSRWGSPTTSALERALSSLERAQGTVVCSSGMAAIHLALLICAVERQGPMLCSRDLYGSTLTLIQTVFGGIGRQIIFHDFADLAGLEAAVQLHAPGVIYFEVLSNPMLKVIDAPEVIQIGHRYGARVIVDNTFLTPYIFRPLEAGADLVCHSLSKYISGHGDVMAGAVSCRLDEIETLRGYCANVGSVPAANASWLALRGIKTLELRMERHCQNALELAKHLSNHPLVQEVLYPGLISHPQHAIAQRVFKQGCYGGMLAFRLKKGNKEKAYRLIDSLKLFTPAGSLGEVQSLIIYPASTTHHTLSEEELEAVGIGTDSLRVSVGIENVEDLKADLDQALDALQAG